MIVEPRVHGQILLHEACFFLIRFVHLCSRGHRIAVIMAAFQAAERSSILLARSRKILTFLVGFFLS